MHTIYHTEAFILKLTPSGEANARVWLFTRDMGLIVASVQGVRKAGAKLMSSLIEYGFVHVDLVKGREVWRLISVSMLQQIVADIQNPIYRRPFVRSISFVERLVVGEGMEHTDLFSHLGILGDFLLHAKDISPEIVDTLSLWKIATMLGYIAVEPEDEKFFDTLFAEAVYLVQESTMKMMIRKVHESLISAHL
ncbi:MAG: recombination protein O N-terminal domain-containing protein [bacterium]